MISNRKKRKKVFTEIETGFSAKVGNSSGFSAQKQVISKKKKTRKKKEKGLHRNRDGFFHRFPTLLPPKSRQLLHNFVTKSLQGGPFSFFKQKSASKALKPCDFACFSGQWGEFEPPWQRYWLWMPAGAKTRRLTPEICYTLRRNTARVMKELI